MANGSTAPALSIQTQQLVAQVLSILGMLAATFGWLTPEQVAGITTNILAALGPIAAIGGFVWSLLASRKNSLVTAVASMPEVRAVVTEPTVAGRELAHSESTPSNVVVALPTGSPIPTAPPHP